MTDTCARDPVALVADDGFAWSKRTSGFVPWTIFHDEPTANRAVKNPVAFFQTFGVPNPRELFRTIDEHLTLEITLADVYWYGKKWLLQNGFSYPEAFEPRKSEWVPIWPPMLTLVEVEPEWRSVDFEEDILRREERRKREELDRSISGTCPTCATTRDLAIMDIGPRHVYVHGQKYENARACRADNFHRERGTITTWLFASGDEDVA